MPKVIKSAGRDIILKVKCACEEERDNNGPTVPFSKVRARVAYLTGVSERTVTQITQEGNVASASSSKIVTPGKTRNRKKKINELDDFDKCAIRHIIQSFYVVKKEIPTINKLWLALKADIDFKYGRTSLRTILKTMGYKYKKCQSKRKVLIERSDIAAWRARYIQRLRKNRREENRPVIYLDETYIHASYHLQKCWQSEEEPGILASDSVGARWIIAHAGGKTGFVENGLLLFKSKSKSSDYHDDMNSANFMRWMKEKIVPNLPGNSIVVMDNASYHCTQLSKNYLLKLQTYKTNKLSLLTNEMGSDIFYDGTVYTGSAGLAMFYLLCSLNETNDHKELETLQSAMNYLKLDNLKGKRISFLCGDAGPLAIAMVTSYRLGKKKCSDNIPDYRSLYNRLLSLSSLVNDSPDEILYGKAGYLYALLFVNKYVSGNKAIPPSHIEKVINAILQSGKDLSAKENFSSPLLWRWHNKAYLGAAHGMAGILCMLLQASVHINSDELQNFIKPTLEWLIMQQFPSGNFPSSVDSGSGDKLVQWCHGAPGFVSLCILASQVFDDEKYMKIAVQLGEMIWKRGLCKKGYSLCHGVSGNAYAFIQLYQATKKPLYLYRACCFMEWCLLERPGTEQRQPDRPASLFEGLLGRLYLAEDICHAKDARFPGFNV